MRITFLFLALILLKPAYSQYVTDTYYQGGELRYEDHVYKDGIKTVKFHPVGSNMGFPIIKLFTGETLELSFDDLFEDYVDYSYTVVHCNADWTPSGLLKQEYISNFQEYFLQNFEYSVNALIPYTNYRLTIPNENMRLTKSGNYVLIIYDSNNPDDLLITRRFMVYEDRVNVGGEVKRATQVELMNTHQEVDFVINHSGYNIPNPFTDLKVTLMQNQRWDNAITQLKPQFLQNSQLLYQYDRENNFPGINEFRFFDIKNLQSLTINVRKIDRDSVYTAYLAEESNREIGKYVVYFDINGQFVVRRLDADNSEFQSDYAYVDFLLSYPAPLETGDVYIFGKFTDWKLLPEYRMKYDYKRGAYRLRALLKQGYYNFMYATKQDGEQSINLSKIEGSHWETENEYQILVYHREVGQRFDKLVGYGQLSSEDLY